MIYLNNSVAYVFSLFGDDKCDWIYEGDKDMFISVTTSMLLASMNPKCSIAVGMYKEVSEDIDCWTHELIEISICKTLFKLGGMYDFMISHRLTSLCCMSVLGDIRLVNPDEYIASEWKEYPKHPKPLRQAKVISLADGQENA